MYCICVIYCVPSYTVYMYTVEMTRMLELGTIVIKSNRELQLEGIAPNSNLLPNTVQARFGRLLQEQNGNHAVVVAEDADLNKAAGVALYKQTIADAQLAGFRVLVGGEPISHASGGNFG
ncbi:putative aldehyde dehydrogenase family 7 member A1 homolog isoform X2 [Paramacrobiotus metropolitanus]|uniref:putative aldehyde dehydrogenase family 7 member A1 homolog isoform X2 n=1 Tax=Paramacrobiotus metropolitanus TaxID=2943436 RepID=UPI002445B7CD|nr:putative aldehyde dehydrogenase family 7 member A1 homolog isoform X2 [Paramacrobiotus metropolitanus]